MLDFWDDKRAAAESPATFPWPSSTTSIATGADRCGYSCGATGQPIADESLPCQVKALGITRQVFALVLPSGPGRCEVEAALICPGQGPVRSLREFDLAN